MQNQSQKIGTIGEGIAVNHLKEKGYQVLDRNFKTKWGELDIVANHNKTIVFVEVKTLIKKPRSDFLPEDEITFRKAKQLQKMAQIYLSSKKLPLDISQQIDIMAIEFNTLNDYNIRHTENAIGDY